MAHSTREGLLRQAEQAHNDLDRFMMNLVSMGTVYGEAHPDYKEFCESLAANALKIQKVLDEFRENRM